MKETIVQLLPDEETAQCDACDALAVLVIDPAPGCEGTWLCRTCASALVLDLAELLHTETITAPGGCA